MRKVALVFLILTLAVPVFAADDIETYKTIYALTSTNQEQLAILQMMVDQKVANAGDFYVAALRRLISEFPNLKTANQLNAADAQALLLAEVLGEEKKTEAANDLWQLTDLFSRDPLVKSNVMIALGKMQDQTHLSVVIQTLERANDSVGDSYYNEVLARAAIIALENYNDPKGFIPIYFSTLSWYSSWVKNQATQTMNKLAPDPSPFMEQIIKNELYSQEIKLDALQNIEASDSVSKEKKAELAKIALSESWVMPTTDARQTLAMSQSRKLALDMFAKNGVPDAETYELINRIYTNAPSLTEKQDVIITLIKLGSDEAVKILSDHLMEMNWKKRNDNISNDDIDLTRFLITALGDIKNRSAIPILNATAALDWTDVIKNMARNARKQIEDGTQSYL